MNKRAFKLQEFMAHQGPVNCVSIGRKSGSVFATGSDDRKVNVWAIGKPNALLSLSGHQTPVECVSFDAAEEVVVAGSSGGSLKLWDLETAKVVRTMSTHRSNCISVDFHPYGEFFASGSVDTNLKVWDIRRKTCIQTYTGHTAPINVIKFSPDGRWVVSGGEDGTIKLWDLTTGKLMQDFATHTGAVTTLDFHPHEFLLASGSADRTVKFWDLETFECVSTTNPDTTRVRAVTYTPDGRVLLSATQDNLKVWDWEPCRTYDTIDVSWNKVTDMFINSHSDQLVSCSFNNTFVGVWVVNLQNVSPFNGQDAAPVSAAPSIPSGKENVPGIDVAATPASRRNDPLMMSKTSRKHYVKDRNVTKSFARDADDSEEDDAHQRRPKSPPRRAPVEDDHAGKNVGTSMGDSFPYKDLNEQLPAARAQAGVSDRSAAAAGNGLKGLNINDFVPKSAPAEVVSDGGLSEAEIIGEVLKDNGAMCSILQTRLTNMRVVRNMWSAGNVKGAVEAIPKMKDQSVLVDFLTNAMEKPNSFNLDCCVALVPQVRDLMSSPHDEYGLVALKTTHILLKCFSNVIRSTRAAGPTSVGVDLNLEERLGKCEVCYDGFVNMKPQVNKIAGMSSSSAPVARDVLKAIAQLG